MSIYLDERGGVHSEPDDLITFGDVNDGGQCWQCGCTDERACPGGCWWVADDLCSACWSGKGAG